MGDEPKKRNPRRGKIKEGKKGEPATFAPGTAAPNSGFDPAAVADELKLWWVDGAGDKYLIELAGGRWSEWSERKVLKRMRMLPGRMIALRPRDGEMISESDQVFQHVMEHKIIEEAIPALAGYPAGIHTFNSQRVVVKTAPRLLTAAPGEWEMTRLLIEGLLGPEQSPYFYGWLKIACEALYLGGPGNFRPGQALIFAGPKDCGKSRIQHQIITWLLGGRSADPGAYMFGRSDFNGEMVGAEHLLMEDPVTSTLTKDRVFFGEMVKGIVVNDTHRLHRKREDALTGSPYWRLTISINDDPDKMRVLPLLTPDMKDKLMLFHVAKNPLPMPTGTLKERAAFRAQIASELPAFLHWLLHEHEIPEAIRGDRFGVREWQHPRLVLDLFDDTPHAELLALVDAAEFETSMSAKKKLWELEGESNGHVWKGSAIRLEKLLTGEAEERACSVAKEGKKLFAHNKGSRLLGRLKEDEPDRVAPWRTGTERGWMISRPIAS